MEKREKSEKLKRLFLYNTSKCTENCHVCYYPTRYCHETICMYVSILSSMLKCAGISKITLGKH